ncbi:MAG: hypothetical protein RDU20_03145 [Desulfomonilaceae bacterium]|nr:hypothetical protein [Desulfomonilaceae bacterium]
MRKVFVLPGSVLLVFLLMQACAVAGDAEIVTAIVESREAVKPLPNPSSIDSDLTEERAYAIQGRLVDAMGRKGKSIGGYKAGLTSANTQQRFKAKSALLAPMFKHGKLEPGAAVDRKDFVRLFLETEIGFSPRETIAGPVEDVESLKKLIGKIYPVIELPDIRFADPKNLTVPDIVADAVGSSKYLVGTGVPMGDVDVNNLKVTLAMDGETVNQGMGSDALGDQWKALLWLVNGVVKQGWTVSPDQILITGALGNMIPGRPGVYEAVWDDLGTIAFTIR